MSETGEFCFYTQCNVSVPKTQQNVLPGAGGENYCAMVHASPDRARTGPPAAAVGAVAVGGGGGDGGARPQLRRALH